MIVLGIAKWGFLILLIVCSSVVISLFYLSGEDNDYVDKELEDDLPYSPKPVIQFSREVLDDHFDKCLFNSLLSDLGGTNTSEVLFPQFKRHLKLETVKSVKVKKRPVFTILKSFTDLMLAFHRVEVVLIEPSILFCMLAQQYKDLLLQRKFHLKDFTSSKHIITLGIRGKDVKEFEKAGVRETIRAYGFRMEFVNEPLLEWMKVGNVTFSGSHFTSHVFFKNSEWTIHLVPFYERGSYLWHASLRTLPNAKIPYEELYFTKSASAYEKFDFKSLGFKDDFLTNINIPSNIQYFLFETTSSRFLECNSTIVSQFHHSNLTGVPNKHSSLSVNHFNKRTIVALQELKAFFNPLLMHFWIWSGTMLGWYRQCDVIPYTSDIDFGAWASEVDDLDELVHRFDSSDHLQLKQRMGIVQQGLEFNIDCHHLRVDVFFLYSQSNGTWYAGHRPSKGYYFKYHHPNFSLCSADLLGHKALVPCETEEVIVTEYGPKWMEPVSSWNYESSIKNRGPNIYWDKDMLKKVYLDN